MNVIIQAVYKILAPEVALVSYVSYSLHTHILECQPFVRVEFEYCLLGAPMK